MLLECCSIELLCAIAGGCSLSMFGLFRNLDCMHACMLHLQLCGIITTSRKHASFARPSLPAFVHALSTFWSQAHHILAFKVASMSSFTLMLMLSPAVTHLRSRSGIYQGGWFGTACMAFQQPWAGRA